MEGGGGGKMGYGGGGGGGGHHHDTAKLLKAFSRTVEPRNFGIGLVAGFLIVTCAYFSTAKFDAIHIAITSPSTNAAAAGISSLSNAAAGRSSKHQSDLGAQDQDALSRVGSKAEVLDRDDNGGGGGTVSSPGPDLSHDASLLDKKKDEAFAKDGDAATAAPATPDADTKDGEVLAEDGDAVGGGAAAVLLPPLSSEEPTNSTQEQGVLEDEELQVQDAVANLSKKSSSNNGSSPSVVPSDPATLPVPVKQIPHNPEVKQTEGLVERRREWKPLCDLTSNRRIDWCELDGDVRVLGANGTVTLVAPPDADDRTFRAEEWRIKPYPRKADPNAMRFVRELTVRSLPAPVADAAPACTDWHGVPGLVFSERGYTGNYFHAYTDVILPLFLTAKQYSGEVQFLVSDFQMWWVGKFLPVFKSLSNYDLIDLASDGRVRCFRHVQVGLTSHADFSIDPLRAPNGYSMVDFTRFMRRTYGLPRDLAAPPPPSSAAAGNNNTKNKPWRPRLLVIARARTRRFVNTEEIVRAAEKAGFEAVVSEGNHEVAPFAELANSCDAMLGVHGAGLTNMVFLPTGGVVIQVVPLGGLEFVAGYFRSPSRDMGLKYLEYRIATEESTLVEQYPRDHPIFTDPDGVKSKGWDSLKAAYLDKQDVRLNMQRFRPVLKKAIAHLRLRASNSSAAKLSTDRPN